MEYSRYGTAIYGTSLYLYEDIDATLSLTVKINPDITVPVIVNPS